MWNIDHQDENGLVELVSPLHKLIEKRYKLNHFGRVVNVALSDFLARRIESEDVCTDYNGVLYRIGLVSSAIGRSSTSASSPFMIERSDVWCDDRSSVHLMVIVWSVQSTTPGQTELKKITEILAGELCHIFIASQNDLMHHIAVAVCQQQLRAALQGLKGVAFVANESILPRQSGISSKPMASPPALKFEAPRQSHLQNRVVLDLGELARDLKGCSAVEVEDNTVILNGLVFPKGVSLIVGGGFHGKSTLLRTIAAGVYNKVPGDGREFCVTVADALVIRSEDGRYVNNCNISAFISDLPSLPGSSNSVDTRRFSTDEASGSTSQAANTIDAIEFGSSLLLFDEDFSAANFMSRDGRMRALVMDESITPFLYRVNGLYAAKAVSSIVVVGGVGDWLDVPDCVVLMDKYCCQEATEKARSISRQFSHGHVQFAGKGVVHRLKWERSFDPIPRRPVYDVSASLSQPKRLTVLGECFGLSIATNDTCREAILDLSKCEQVQRTKSYLLGIAYCVLWILRQSVRDRSLGIPELLGKLNSFLDAGGPKELVSEFLSSEATGAPLARLGFACRPRLLEVGQALVRLRLMRFEEVCKGDDGMCEAAAAESEEDIKRKDLMKMWHARRTIR